MVINNRSSPANAKSISPTTGRTFDSFIVVVMKFLLLKNSGRKKLTTFFMTSSSGIKLCSNTRLLIIALRRGKGSPASFSPIFTLSVLRSNTLPSFKVSSNNLVNPTPLTPLKINMNFFPVVEKSDRAFEMRFISLSLPMIRSSDKDKLLTSSCTSFAKTILPLPLLLLIKDRSSAFFMSSSGVVASMGIERYLRLERSLSFSRARIRRFPVGILFVPRS